MAWFYAGICVTLVLVYVIGSLIRRLFFFQAEDGIRDLVRSRGLGDMYKRQLILLVIRMFPDINAEDRSQAIGKRAVQVGGGYNSCLLYTSDAADERSSVDLGGRRIIKKQT